MRDYQIKNKINKNNCLHAIIDYKALFLYFSIENNKL